MARLSNLAIRKLGANEIIGRDGKVDDRNSSKKLKNTKSGIQTRIRITKEPTFLTPSTKEAFNQLRQAFTKAPNFQHFDPAYYI